ncbi:hypothetical protein ISG33_10985 [Glaciecola sp. MH2013]|nr:hypothetical protein [Glaciecola sp. MH2013]
MQRKTKRFFQNNRRLYQFFIGFLIFMGPIAGATMLFAAPLLGYLAVNAVSLLEFAMVACSLALLCIVFVQFYFLYWQSSELQFLKLSMGKGRALLHHFVALNRQAAIFHILVLAAFARIEINIQSMIYVVVCYLSLFATFLWRYKLYSGSPFILKERLNAWLSASSLGEKASVGEKIKEVTKTRLNTKLFFYLMRSGAWLRALLVVAMYVLMAKLATSDIDTAFLAGIGISIMMLGSFFVALLSKLVQTNLHRDMIFWQSLGQAMPTRLTGLIKRVKWALISLFPLVFISAYLLTRI